MGSRRRSLVPSEMEGDPGDSSHESRERRPEVGGSGAALPHMADDGDRGYDGGECRCGYVLGAEPHPHHHPRERPGQRPGGLGHASRRRRRWCAGGAAARPRGGLAGVDGTSRWGLRHDRCPGARRRRRGAPVAVQSVGHRSAAGGRLETGGGGPALSPLACGRRRTGLGRGGAGDVRGGAGRRGARRRRDRAGRPACGRRPAEHHPPERGGRGGDVVDAEHPDVLRRQNADGALVPRPLDRPAQPAALRVLDGRRAGAAGAPRSQRGRAERRRAAPAPRQRCAGAPRRRHDPAAGGGGAQERDAPRRLPVARG